jgi:hypothetical protein
MLTTAAIVTTEPIQAELHSCRTCGGWRCLISRSDPPLTRKRCATKKEVAEALTEALRTHRECDGIRVRKITAFKDTCGVANWDAEFEVSKAGQALTAEQQRVMLAAKLGVQTQLDLSEDS